MTFPCIRFQFAIISLLITFYGEETIVSETEISSFEKTLTVLLRPIARLIIANEMPLTRVVEILKRVLVSTSEADGADTDSYISLKTGVHRKDIKRLRNNTGSIKASACVATPIASVITCWMNEPAFQDATGRPRPLARGGTATQPGFNNLVKFTKMDVPPATVLAELLSQGIVSHNDDDLIVLMSDTYLPKIGDAVLDALQATLSEHLNVSVSNALAAAEYPKAFDRVLRYSHLSQASVDQLEVASRNGALDYLNTLNTLAHAYQLADATEGRDATGRFVTGVFISPTLAIVPDNKQRETT